MYSVHRGDGKHLYTITSLDDANHILLVSLKFRRCFPSHSLQSGFVRQSWFLEEFFFDMINLPLKASISVFLMELTPNRRHIWIARCSIALNIAMFICFFVNIMYRCRPLNYYWNRFDLSKKGTCLSAAAQVEILIGLNIGTVILDWMLATLPAFILWDLRMPIRRKLMVGSLMSLGVAYVLFSVQPIFYA
jgi:hypothetical protein